MALGRQLQQLFAWATLADLAGHSLGARVHSDDSAAGSSVGLLQVGQKVGRDGRFTLTEKVKTWHLGGGTAPGPDEGWQLLAAGSFGEAYRSWDEGLGKYVIVKLFFHFDKSDEGSSNSSEGKVQYIDLNSATDFEKTILEAEQWACDQVQFIHKQANRYGLRHPGADHICECYEADLNSGYLVMEDCGTELFEWQPNSEAERLNGANKVVLSTLKALDLLKEADYPHVYIHHDLKPENLAYTLDKDGLPNVKLIDWGALRLTGYPRDSQQDCVMSPDYAPTEFRLAKHVTPPCHMEGKAWTYDVFSVGAIWARYLTDMMPLYYFTEFQFSGMQSKSRHKVPAGVAKLVEKMTAWYVSRPLPWELVMSPVLSPDGFSLETYLGTWKAGTRDESFRSYRLSKASNYYLPSVEGQYELTVLTDYEVAGRVRLGEDSCNFWSRSEEKEDGTSWTRESRCCKVELQYETEVKKFKIFNVDRNVSLAVTFCPTSFWALRFQEAPVEDETPRDYVEQFTPFRRPLPSDPKKVAEQRWKARQEEDSWGCGGCGR